jgi:hypothetical protein
MAFGSNKTKLEPFLVRGVLKEAVPREVGLVGMADNDLMRKMAHLSIVTADSQTLFCLVVP